MPSAKIRLKASGADLSARLSRSAYPEPVREVAGSVLSGIDAAQVGTRLHPSTKARIIEDVAKLERLLAAAE